MSEGDNFALNFDSAIEQKSSKEFTFRLTILDCELLIEL